MKNMKILFRRNYIWTQRPAGAFLAAGKTIWEINSIWVIMCMYVVNCFRSTIHINGSMPKNYYKSSFFTQRMTSKKKNLRIVSEPFICTSHRRFVVVFSIPLVGFFLCNLCHSRGFWNRWMEASVGIWVCSRYPNAVGGLFFLKKNLLILFYMDLNNVWQWLPLIELNVLNITDKDYLGFTGYVGCLGRWWVSLTWKAQMDNLCDINGYMCVLECLDIFLIYSFWIFRFLNTSIFLFLDSW